MNILTMMISMRYIILSVWFASVSCYKFKNFNLPLEDTPITHTDMAQLFQFCYANKSNPIIITENLAKTLHRKLADSIKAPVIIINDEFISKDIQLYYPTYPMYILSMTTQMELDALLSKLMSSPFWSIQSAFFVIVESVKSCEKDSIGVLGLLWRYEMLSCVVVCSSTGTETTLYTYNPFTKRAPDPWIEIKKNWFDHHQRPVTFYKQIFTNDHNICANLTFDKTKVLDGYPAKIATTEAQLTQLTFFEVFTSLNMTPQMTDFGSDLLLLVLSILNNTQDTSTITFADYVTQFDDVLPVIFETSYVIVTQKRSFLPVFYEIESVFDINGAIGIIIILLLITVLIILHNGYQVRLAILDVLKLLMSMGIGTPLDRLAMKLTFFTAFLFVFIFGPALEGQIFASLTRPPSQNVESFKDLYDQKYHVYYIEALHNSILEEELWKTEEEMKYLHPRPLPFYPLECLELMMQYPDVACIFEESFMLYWSRKIHFHASKRFVFKKNNFYHYRLDWSLGKRFYQRLLKFEELGISKRDMLVDVPIASNKMKIAKRKEKMLDHHIIDAEDLTNLYIFMAFFQLLAVIIFGIEHIVAYYRRQRR
ncbi:uncharacterized protein LOC130669541 [Microplitis mediator]|uniref:uncharacterized protein LOC130669541 n=1 Tax=Microplitis mediator TaxID=375433 RepID=UPI002556880B|nr:uncharacterized protein LOC130669541 [Microplitis mediator]